MKVVETKVEIEKHVVVPEHKIRVKVDYDSYCNAYGLKQELSRISWGDCKNWVEMEVTSEQLKDMINKCVNIKIVE